MAPCEARGRPASTLLARRSLCFDGAHVLRRVLCNRCEYPRRAVAHQYVFQMYRLSKVHPPDREVLKDVTLAFLPGAKIGVLGYNGAGKSTLLLIMAGRATDVRGE